MSADPSSPAVEAAAVEALARVWWDASADKWCFVAGHRIPVPLPSADTPSEGEAADLFPRNAEEDPPR